MTDSLASRIAAFGALRLLLLALAALAVVFTPEPEARTVITWPQIVPTLIAPAVAPIIFVVVLLDLLMAKVMSAGEEDTAKKTHTRQVMLADTVAAAAIAFAYLPFFLALGR